MCLAIPGEILEISGDDPLTRMGKVSFGGVTRDINLAYVPEAAVGQYVVVHAGFALSVLDEDEALETISYLEQMEIGELPPIESTE